MRFQLTFHVKHNPTVIPVNYQYPLASAIYKILQQADAGYSSFLHEKGYGKGFKLFTFSDINCPFTISRDRLILRGQKMYLTLCFHLPRAAATFITGLFQSQTVTIADQKSKTVFVVEQVVSLSGRLEPTDQNNTTPVEARLQLLSPVVCGIKNERGSYTFLAPDDERYNTMLLMNWQEKCKTVFGDTADRLIDQAVIQPLFYHNPPKSRLVTIKAGTPAETKIRGYNNFMFHVKGSCAAVDLIVNSGVGLYNAQGMSCVEITALVN